MSASVARLVSVLYLDHIPLYAARPSDAGLRLRLTLETNWNPNCYLATDETCKRIAQLTRAHDYDVIVVGNNLGAGLVKARYIDKRLIGRVVVVFNDKPKGTEGYRALGIKQFKERLKLWEHVKTRFSSFMH